MEDLSLQLRHAKRGKATKLDLSSKEISTVPSDVYAIATIEVLDLSNNKITSIDSKLQNLTNLKFLDLSNNSLITLPNCLTKMDQLQVLNLSGNPLTTQFEPLLKKENQSGSTLHKVLKGCFDGTLKVDDSFPSFDKSNNGNEQLKIGKSPSWFEDDIDLKKKESSSSSNDPQQLMVQLKQTENMLSREQQKNIELENELAKLRSAGGGSAFTTPLSSSPLNIDSTILKMLEIDLTHLEVNEKISQGGFSIVHKGFYKGTSVAVKKIFNPNITSEMMDEFNNEIDMLNRLRHPNIVLLMGVCSKPQNISIVTELLPGGSLYTLLHSSKVEIKQNTKINMAIDIVLALDYMHLSDIVHRDIKSQNILLDEKMKIKLCDFGLARHQKDLNKGYMKYAGTPAYMAPEIFQKKNYDRKIDIFAFGTLLWELFTKKVPYDGLDPADVSSRVTAGDTLNTTGIPKGIADIINACRAFDPKKRPEFSKVLEMLYSIE